MLSLRNLSRSRGSNPDIPGLEVIDTPSVRFLLRSERIEACRRVMAALDNAQGYSWVLMK